MHAAARWSLIFAAGLGLGFALVRGGQLDRHLPALTERFGLLRAAAPVAEGTAGAADPIRELPGPDWVRVRAGAPSRAPRIEFEPEPEPLSFSNPASEGAEPGELLTPAAVQGSAAPVAPTAPAVVRRRVEPGTTLSEMLLAHYGRQGPRLARQVARFNGLASPDAIRAGRELELPPLDVLERMVD